MARPFMHWTPEMIEALKRFRAEGCSYLECADKIGVAGPVLGRKARELGLSHRMNRGTISGQVAALTTESPHG